MPSIDIPKRRPATTQELVPARSALAESLQALVRDLMKHEFEALNTHDAAQFSATVGRIAEQLSAAAATWTRLSDSMRRDWQL